MHLANFDTVSLFLRVGTVGTGVRNILSFIQSVLKIQYLLFQCIRYLKFHSGQGTGTKLDRYLCGTVRKSGTVHKI
jgi:hypothetical protein